MHGTGSPFLAVHRRHLPEAVMVITGLVAGTVGEAQQLAVTAPRHGFPAAGGIVRCAGEVTVWLVTMGDIAVRGGFLNQTAGLDVFPGVFSAPSGPVANVNWLWWL